MQTGTRERKRTRLMPAKTRIKEAETKAKPGTHRRTTGKEVTKKEMTDTLSEEADPPTDQNPQEHHPEIGNAEGKDLPTDQDPQEHHPEIGNAEGKDHRTDQDPQGHHPGIENAEGKDPGETDGKAEPYREQIRTVPSKASSNMTINQMTKPPST